MKSKPLLAVALLVAFGGTAIANETPDSRLTAPNLESITIEDVKGDVYFLASDDMVGRETTRPEIDITANYVRSRMERAGLEPAGEDDTWYQTVKLKYRQWESPPALTVKAGDSGQLLEYGKHFVSTGGPDAGVILEDAEIAFAGYAIRDAERAYDDVAGVDLQGKLAIILRYEPTPWRKGGGRNPFSRSSYLQTKAKVCRDAGAIGILMVTGPESLGGSDNRRDLPSPEAAEKSPPLSLDESDSEPENGLPFFHISIEAADILLGGEGRTSEVQKIFDTGDFLQRPDLSDTRIDLTATSKVIRDDCRNVAGMIRGEVDEWIIFGAHHDHLGRGYFGARDVREGGMGKVHNGADDNASGVSTVLEIAEAYAKSGLKPRRSMLFLTFTGEEKGLLGSRWYVRNPLIPHNKVVAMINIDMIGRINDGKIGLQGTQCSEMVEGHCRAAAKLFPELDVIFSENPPPAASDHWPFYREAGIPVFFPFGGMNKLMHTAEDDAETLNYKDLTTTIRLLAEIGWRISEDPAQADYNGPVKDAIGPDGKPRNPKAPAPIDPDKEYEEEFSAG